MAHPSLQRHDRHTSRTAPSVLRPRQQNPTHNPAGHAEAAPEWILQRARTEPTSLTPADVHILQRTVGNRATSRLLSPVLQSSPLPGAANNVQERKAGPIAQRAVQHLDTTQPASQPERPYADGSQVEPAAHRMSSHDAGAITGVSPIRRSFRLGQREEEPPGRPLHTGKGSEPAPGVGLEVKQAMGGGHRLDNDGDRSRPHGLQAGAKRATSSALKIQRFFWKKKKKKKKKNRKTGADNQTSDNQTIEATEDAPADVSFVVKAAVKTGTKTRGKVSMQEMLAGGGGHSWLAIELGPTYQSLDDLRENSPNGAQIVQTMEEPTLRQMEQNGRTTIGFYPDVTGALNERTMLKQMFKNLPGKILEPEQGKFAGSERGSKSFTITDPVQMLTLLNFVRDHRNRSYNIFRHNCTDFVIDALKSIGLSAGTTSNAAGWTVPSLLYKQIYKKAELGDESATYTDLTARSRTGGRYDRKHVGKRTQKRLDKKLKKLNLDQVEQQAGNEPEVLSWHMNNRFLTVRAGGMTRPGSEIGVTGNVDGEWGEIIYQGGSTWVPLYEFQQAFGVPYPGTEEEAKPDMPEPDTDVADPDQPIELV